MKSLLPVVICLFLLSSCLVKDDKKAIRASFVHYQSAVINADGTQAAFCADMRTKKYFSGILKHVLNSDSVTVSKLPLIDRLMILGLRVSTEKKFLQTGSEDLALIFAVQNQLINKSSVENVVPGNITITGDSALLEIAGPAGEKSRNLMFRKEKDAWKIDLTATFRETEALLKKMTASTGMTEDDLIRGFIEQSTGKMPGQNTWEPLK